MTIAWTKLSNRSAKAVCSTGTEAIVQPVKASTTVAFSTAVAGNTVTIRGITFTAIANGGTATTRTEFAVGAGGTADSDTGDAFAAVVNDTTDLTGVTASNSSGTVTIAAEDYGTGPNTWTVTKVGDPITLGAAVLEDGVDIVGVPLSDVGSVSVHAEADTKTATLTGGTLTCYAFNARTGKWNRYADGDLALGTAYVGHAWALTVTTPAAYIAWVPTGVTISADGLTVFLDSFETDNRSTSGRAL